VVVVVVVVVVLLFMLSLFLPRRGKENGVQWS